LSIKEELILFYLGSKDTNIEIKKETFLKMIPQTLLKDSHWGRFSVCLTFDDERFVVLVCPRLHLEEQLVRRWLLDDPRRTLN